MFRKTVIKRIAKHLPRSEHYDKAADLSNQDFEMSLGQLSMIESLMQTSNLIEDEKDKIETKLMSLSHSGAQQTIEYLKTNQMNAIESGNNYGPEEIRSQLDDKMNDMKA